jgi:alkylation response protein AidB-like acyl-CoA dehydrogenase
MDFEWTKEQEALRERIVEFGERLNERLAERDHAAEFSKENWVKCADFGIQGSAVPPEYGGLGQDLLTTMLIMEGLGYSCRDNGLIFALNAQMWSVQHPILTFGTDAQKEKYLPGLCSGELIGAHGMTEPGSGSDAFSLRTRAERRDGGYVLNGTKTMVTNAPVADLAVVFAATDPSRGRWGLSTFIVERGTPGFSVSRDMKKMGLRTSTMGELVLQDCALPEESRLGKEGIGASLFDNSMEWERSCILGANLGAMERQLEESIRYARERQQFGQPIGRFQSVSNRIADMKVRLESARLVLYKVAWQKQRGKSGTLNAAIAKLYLSECFVQSSLDAIRIHGGYGYMSESEVERDLRDAIGGTLYSGTSDIQRMIITRLLGL